MSSKQSLLNLTQSAANNAAKSAPKQAVSKSAKCAVAEFEVGTYKELKDKEVVGDEMEHDHIPSFAATKAATEEKLKRKLTKAEALNLKNNTLTVELKRPRHKRGRTFGGKNKKAQIEADAKNLGAAAKRDIDTHLDNAKEDLKNKAITQQEYNKLVLALADLDKQNRAKGLY